MFKMLENLAEFGTSSPPVEPQESISLVVVDGFRTYQPNMVV
jgi:hypothetical protein